MRHKRRFSPGDYKIAQPGYTQPTRWLRKIILFVLLLAGGWFIFDYLLSLPAENPAVIRYEVLPIP